jgi:hypothetical protein
MKLKKYNLFSTIAELVYMLQQYGCENKTLLTTLEYYGFTKKQIAEWYFIKGEEK